MALYMTTHRCAVCGSKEIDVIKSQTQQPLYHCRTCGVSMEQPMEAAERNRIDSALFTGNYSVKEAADWNRRYQNLGIQNRCFISGALNR